MTWSGSRRVNSWMGIPHQHEHGYVTPGHRDASLGAVAGRRLMQGLIDEGAGTGSILNSRWSDQHACELYENFGFRLLEP